MASLLIDAGPGSGKTTTLVDACKIIADISFNFEHTLTDEINQIYDWSESELPVTKDICMAAFSKEIQLTLEKKTPDWCTTKTMHGLGWKILRDSEDSNPKMDPRSWHRLVKRITGTDWEDIPYIEKKLWYFAHSIVEKLKCNLLEPEGNNILDVCEKYPISEENPDEEVVSHSQKLFYEMTKWPRAIEYIDMIWLPIYKGMISSPKYKVGLIDECQDLNSAQIEMSLQLFENRIYCGDRQQSIFGFAGADSKSIPKIRDKTETELPLKTCWRCPTSAIERANGLFINQRQYKPIIPRDQAPLGETRRIQSKELKDEVRNKKDVLIMARTNAPLFKTAMRLGIEGIPCKILGKDTETTLINKIKQSKAKNVTSLLLWVDQRIEELEGNDKALYFIDTLECIKVLAEMSDNMEELKSSLSRLFNPDKWHISLASVHRAKGLESYNCYYLSEVPIPHPLAKSQWQRSQEINLLYVLYTRTRHNFVTVIGE